MSYSASIPDLEAELDQLWPAWDAVVPRSGGLRAKGRPFHHVAYSDLARLKWLLKRRLQLLKGQDAWGVLVAQDGRNPLKCYAHPVPPLVDGTPARPEPPPRTRP